LRNKDILKIYSLKTLNRHKNNRNKTIVDGNHKRRRKKYIAVVNND